MPTRELLPHLLLLLLHILVALALVSSQSDPCSEEVRIKRDSNHTLWSGESFILKCPVIYCAVRPTVSWCVLYHSHCFRLQNMLQNTTEKNNTLELNLYFQPAWVNDTGLYICEANFSKKTIRSHQVTIIVKGAQINTTNPPSNFTGTSRPKTPVASSWLLPILASVAAACTFIIICSSLSYCLWRHRAKQKRAPAARNLPDLPQTPAEVWPLYHTGAGSQSSPPATTIVYDNDDDPRGKGPARPEAVYSNQNSETQLPIVYASLNHSTKGRSCPRKGTAVKEEFTEYTAICVRS
ncbi:B- and T-lymphocyte attenuator isoform X2 [Ornithorhynchus anatinus]|uniref:B- and T-lymphocyte attenuator isoform X2 n=1 Tax=Ornithorhynchus anatinus TaxID=9258 RepID=UPI0010A8D235|nr:B- and T-lymphocyte attenuator isoform X2 [Ornithorhynchus anatinus]